MGKGHATHFLERLERLAPADVELALGLYRDAPLVKSVLLKASLPPGDGRVAMCIGRDGNGPWLVVERDGAFVTCLGVGMKHDLPVVQRDQLDAISTMESKLRACIKASRELTGADRPSARFVAEAFLSGWRMSRERLLAAQALQPLMRGVYLSAAQDSLDRFCSLTDRLSRAERFGAKHAPLFAEREQMAWKTAHLLVASVDEIPPVIEHIGESGPHYGWALSSLLFSSGYLGPTYRGLWLVAQLGPWVMPHLRAIDEAPESVTDRLYASIGLAAVGVRHLQLRGEVLKRLKRTPDWMKNAKEATRTIGIRMRSQLLDVVLDERHPEREPTRGFALMDEVGLTLENTGPELFHQLARAYLLNLQPITGVLKGADKLAQSVGWLAPLPGADMNLPEAATASMPELETSFKEHVFALETTKLMVPFEAARPTPAHGKGRNARCACGSGKKHKRCCGA